MIYSFINPKQFQKNLQSFILSVHKLGFLAKSPETVDKLEGLVALWAKEIELVLAKSEQVG